jgi:hypothetical protein
MGEEIYDLIYEQSHPFYQKGVHFLFRNKPFLCWCQEYVPRILLELAETVAKFGVPGQCLKFMVVRAVMSVHGLIYKHGEVEANKEGRSIGSGHILQASTIYLPTVTEVGDTRVRNQPGDVMPES